MTREELKEHCEEKIRISEILARGKEPSDKIYEEHKLILELLEQESCEDVVSRQAVFDLIDELARAISDERICISRGRSTATIMQDILHLPSVTPHSKKGLCKDCKYFEYDSFAIVDGIPLIVAHEICSKWGNGCKTSEDGYCFLFEPLEESEVEE